MSIEEIIWKLNREYERRVNISIVSVGNKFPTETVTAKGGSKGVTVSVNSGVNCWLKGFGLGVDGRDGFLSPSPYSKTFIFC